MVKLVELPGIRCLAVQEMNRQGLLRMRTASAAYNRKT